ncbi:hypothetical protein [Motiliproteus sp. MSK22-1]|uniref:hypothetical protein n=1 Tax=Motiliproteus sp. MSK22-1 TaxID=1897630 RepID=UPI0009771223|nr:hypothetical protein [Motiliproteus sp. MSK22-1]OMH35331.1 hypothetical protein BGP75_10670 [Motiliproteus sp. MSK22-1]
MTETPTSSPADSAVSTAPCASETPMLIKNTICIKTELAECYLELAEQLEHCNNPEAAQTFLQLSEKYQQHIQRLSTISATSDAQHTTAGATVLCTNRASPTDDLYAEVHYLMTPYHVIKLALETEQQTQLEWQNQADKEIPSDAEATNNNRQQGMLLQQIVQEQKEYLQMLKQWLSKLPCPETHWDEDPDPPNLDD